MAQRIDYFAASEAIATDSHSAIPTISDYGSADFYRMQLADDDGIALALRDQPMYILLDASTHGGDRVRELMAHAIEQGHIIEVVKDDFTFHDVVDIEGVQGAPYQFRSHIAMQIAFPERYYKFFEGELVWNYSHPKMQALLSLCMSCLTNANHPSDWYGEHEIPCGQKKPGRPKTKKPAADTVTASTASGHKAWVKACQAHKQELSDAWAAYLDTCANRKKAIRQWEQWRADKLAALRAEIAKAENEYENGLSTWAGWVADAKAKHSLIKGKVKPKREDFV